MLPGMIPNIGAAGKVILPSYEYIETGDFTIASTSGPGTSTPLGTESETRQLVLIHMGTYASPPGTVAQGFVSPFTTAYRYSARAANGLFLSTAFSAYDNRDAHMVTDVYPTGTTATMNMTHGSGLTYGTLGRGQYWLYSIYDLRDGSTPYSVTHTTSNSPSVTIPNGGIIFIHISNSTSDINIGFGNDRGTYSSYDYNWACWDYQNLTGSSENKTITVSSDTGNLRIIAIVWK